MKPQNFPHEKNQKPASPSPPAVVAPKNEIDVASSPDEVSRRAYFSYVNQGSRPGHEVQHWLAAEAEMLAERNRTRTHGFHNKT